MGQTSSKNKQEKQEKQEKPSKKNKKKKEEQTQKIFENVTFDIYVEEKESKTEPKSKAIEEILFKLPIVNDPLIGTPKQVQRHLDKMAKYIQNNPDHPESNEIFNVIHLYMHGYLINVVTRQFPYIKGLQTVDIYQETLVALRFKAIPNFKMRKGMSFLNFSKMCIRRHLITLLNASQTKIKDQALNQAISLDSSSFDNDDDDGSRTFANIISDNSMPIDEGVELNEAYNITKDKLFLSLSSFEQHVFKEYLAGYSYYEIAQIIFNIKRPNRVRPETMERYTKSIDNALLRIRTKAIYLKDHSKAEDIPLFIT